MSHKTKVAVIAGVTGQDGMYLSSFLLNKGYNVVGVVRRSSIDNSERLAYIKDHPNLTLVSGDVIDLSSLERIAKTYQPDEWYNLAAQSHVRESFDTPISTVQITGNGALNCLEAIRQHSPGTRYYFAGSSEQFGNSLNTMSLLESCALDEDCFMEPASPYACAKVLGYNLTRNYRESYRLFACTGILFNHESPVRGEMFVTRKITKALAQIKHKVITGISFGNLSSQRDWGFAGDYIKAIWLMLQQDKPCDYVIGTGESHSCQEFLDLAAQFAGIRGVDKYIIIDENLYRPTEVHVLTACAQKAEKKLGWKPETNFAQLVQMMVDHDMHYYNPTYTASERSEICRPFVRDSLCTKED